MLKYSKVIFICTGNTCRGPMAETIFRSFSADNEMKVYSRGLVVLFPEPANPKAVSVLNNNNFFLDDHTSVQFEQNEIDKDTLIITMTDDQKKKVSANYEGVVHLYTIKEFAGESGDVTDPYGGGLDEYEECFLQINRLIKKIVYKLIKEV